MKKMISLLLVLALCLSLCACAQESGAAQTEQNNAEVQNDQTVETTADGYYVQEKTLDDGTSVTIYRDGGPDGAIVKYFSNYPDGAKSEEHYNGEGVLEYTIYIDTDGSTYETFFYPSGNISKDIMKMADGSYTELHFLDNGSVDEATGMITSGAITYEKYVTADGQVTENTYDITLEDDGTWWTTDEWSDGTVVKTCFNADSMPVKEIRSNEATGDYAEVEYANGNRTKEVQTNEKTGDRTEINYYESGNEKTRNSYYASHGMKSFIEYYENGFVKYSLWEYDDGYKVEEKFNEAGYTVYYYDSNLDMEFFADDVGELVKCVSKGQTYEGDAIPSEERRVFEQVRTVPAESSTTTENADGSSSTTTTYADGTVTTSGTTADGCGFYRSVSPDGTESYEEYYPSGNLKLMIYKTAESSQEIHYDEDGYYIYLHHVSPGYDLEITCDETGKVDKVLVNGQEQTDIEKYVKDMFFRSW